MVDFAKLRRPVKQEAEDDPLDTRSSEPLHVKYRPQTLKEVMGQGHAVDSLKKVLDSKTPAHAYLFTGPAGVGKTTLARIIANRFKCEPSNILEIDAATNNGIDAMREVTSALRYHGFGSSPNRGIIIDECHALSKAAWQSLLKSVEEPPPHVFFFFCTTESGKVPDTILTRCHAYTLKPLKYEDVLDLLEYVDEQEKLDTPNEVLALVARACGGSARQALVMLSMVQGCDTAEEAGPILETPMDNKDVIDLCRGLVSGKLTWTVAVDTLKRIPDMNAESVRIVVVNYLAACLKGAKTERDVTRLLDILTPFSTPFLSSDKDAPLLLALGNLIYPPNH